MIPTRLISIRRFRAVLTAALGTVLLLLAACVSPPSAPTAVQEPAAVQIIERYIQARGGPEALLNLQTESAEGDLTLDPGGHTGKIFLKVAATGFTHSLQNTGLPPVQPFGAEECVRVTSVFGGHAQTRACDGHAAWEWDNEFGFGLIPSAPLIALYGLRTDLNILSDYSDIRQLEDETLNGRVCHVLTLKRWGQPPVTWFFDAATGLLVLEMSQSSAAGLTTVSRDDYRKVAGVLIPYRQTYIQANGVKVVMSLRSVEFNSRLDGVNFSPPEDALIQNQQIDTILERYVTACGGAHALAQVHSRVTRSSTVTNNSETSTQVMYQKSPDKVLVVTQDLGVGQSQQSYDGHTGWELSDIQGFRVLQGIELHELAQQADLQMPLHLARDYPLRRWLGKKTIDGRPTVGFTLSNGAISIGACYFDIRSGQLAAMETTVNNGVQGFLPVTMEFSDFRAVDGVVMPFRTETSNPAMHSVTTIQSVVQNQPLADTLFAPRKE